MILNSILHRCSISCVAASLSGPNSPAEQTSGKRKKLTVGDVFNQDDDDSLDGAKKRKLVPLDYGDSGDDSASGMEGRKAATAEEKRAKIKSLIENIPTAKDELFAFQLDWKIVDQVLIVSEFFFMLFCFN